MDRVASLSLLLIVTFRPQFVAPWTGRPHVSLLRLNRLPRREQAAIIAGSGGSGETVSPADVISWMDSEAASPWPAVLGSLSYRRTRCGQPNCAACLSGEQHRSYVLYGRHNGRRFAIYVPEDLTEEVRRDVDNGRALQELLMQAGPRYVIALKRAQEVSRRNPASGRARTGESMARATSSREILRTRFM